MLTIIKNSCEFKIQPQNILSIKECYDGIIVSLNDKTEIRFEIELNPSIRALIPIIEKASMQNNNAVFNIDNAIRADYKHILQIG